MLNCLEPHTLGLIKEILMDISLISIGVLVYIFMITNRNSNFKHLIWAYRIAYTIGIISEIIVILIIFKEGI